MTITAVHATGFRIPREARAVALPPLAKYSDGNQRAQAAQAAQAMLVHLSVRTPENLAYAADGKRSRGAHPNGLCRAWRLLLKVCYAER